MKLYGERPRRRRWHWPAGARWLQPGSHHYSCSASYVVLLLACIRSRRAIWARRAGEWLTMGAGEWQVT